MDILFIASNRQEFTRASLTTLLRTLRPEDRLVVYIDKDISNSEEFIRPRLRPQDVVRITDFGSPVAVMNNYISNTPDGSPIFAKVDNDLIVCPYWLEATLEAMERYPEFELVGIEPFSTQPQWGGNEIVGTDHIGGIGLMRRSAFINRPRPTANGRFGFTEWQYATPQVKCGWMTPPLPVFLLDHLPWSPWKELSVEYLQKQWQRRPWGDYGEAYWELWSWWKDTEYEREAIG